LGLAVDIPIAHCAEELISGTLVPILDGWRRPTIECFVVTSTEGYGIKRIRTFVDWISAYMLQQALLRDKKVSLKVGLHF